MVKGVASLLDRPATARVEQIWNDLEKLCGLTGVRITPFPHFSWQVTEDYDQPALDALLKKLAADTPPFSIRTTGLGIFTGPSPVVYLAIVKDAKLFSIHEALWKETRQFSIRPEPYYSPDQWVPHITLAYGDVSPDNLDCVTRSLAYQSFDWTIRIDNLVSISLTDDRAAPIVRYRLSG
ncbi:MAG TPA: 2'-5' RNA ligase family protein [Anaerolineales bacterium]|nr:2'-5' RNA ligase family protein [Anaerolineales bacterium]